MSLRPCFSDCETLQIFALLFGEIIFKEVIMIFYVFFLLSVLGPNTSWSFSVRSEIDLVASAK